jgi:hypothetical protein
VLDRSSGLHMLGDLKLALLATQKMREKDMTRLEGIVHFVT